MKYIEKHFTCTYYNIGSIRERTLVINIQIHCKNMPKIRLKKYIQKHIKTYKYIGILYSMNIKFTKKKYIEIHMKYIEKH
jgi:hypothetical protein